VAIFKEFAMTAATKVDKSDEIEDDEGRRPAIKR
jgi:hypothetical protein